MIQFRQFRVSGLPVPQGSMRTYRGRVVHDSAKVLHVWREAVAMSARKADVPMFLGPVAVSARFWIPRPKSVPARRRLPETKPDLDKLLRALLDSLTGIAWPEDSRVTDFESVRKRYATPDNPPGVLIGIGLAEED